MNNQQSHLLPGTNTFNRHVFVLCTLASQEVPFGEAQDIKHQLGLHTLNALLLIVGRPGHAHSFCLIPLHGDQTLILLALIHIGSDKVDINVGLLSSVLCKPQFTNLCVFICDSLLDIDSFLDACLHLLLNLATDVAFVVHILLHSFAFITHLSLLDECSVHGQGGSLD